MLNARPSSSYARLAIRCARIQCAPSSISAIDATVPASSTLNAFAGIWARRGPGSHGSAPRHGLPRRIAALKQQGDELRKEAKGLNNAWTEAAPGRSLRRVVHQGAGKIVGSTAGATLNATDTTANPIKTIEAHTPKSISDEFWRPCTGTRRDRIVDENKVMSISNRFLRTILGRRRALRGSKQCTGGSIT
jgi:hypothetical protein